MGEVIMWSVFFVAIIVLALLIVRRAENQRSWHRRHRMSLAEQMRELTLALTLGRRPRHRKP